MESPKARAKRLARGKAYSALHRKEIKIQRRTHYLAHREEIRAKYKAYRALHWNEIKHKQHAYAAAHKEEAAICNKAWRDSHKEELKAQRKIYYAAHREKIRAKAKIYKASRREKDRENFLKREYGMSIMEFNSLLMKQGKACAVCRQSFVRTPVVDHDHKTGKIRGILCWNCNGGIGLLQDSSAILHLAIEYLDKSKEIS